MVKDLTPLVASLNFLNFYFNLSLMVCFGSYSVVEAGSFEIPIVFYYLEMPTLVTLWSFFIGFIGFEGWFATIKPSVDKTCSKDWERFCKDSRLS